MRSKLELLTAMAGEQFAWRKLAGLREKRRKEVKGILVFELRWSKLDQGESKRNEGPAEGAIKFIMWSLHYKVLRVILVAHRHFEFPNNGGIPFSDSWPELECLKVWRDAEIFWRLRRRYVCWLNTVERILWPHRRSGWILFANAIPPTKAFSNFRRNFTLWISQNIRRIFNTMKTKTENPYYSPKSLIHLRQLADCWLHFANRRLAVRLSANGWNVWTLLTEYYSGNNIHRILFRE